MRYCKDCSHKNDKYISTGLQTISARFGEVSHHVKGCGEEKIEYNEDKNGYSLIPVRNKNNDCSWYKRIWWKFWIKETQ